MSRQKRVWMMKKFRILKELIKESTIQEFKAFGVRRKHGKREGSEGGVIFNYGVKKTIFYLEKITN